MNSPRHSTDPQSLLPSNSQQSSLSTQPFQKFSKSSGVDSQALSSSQQSSQSSGQPSHLSSNSSVQSKHITDSHPSQPPQLSSLQFSQSTQQSSSGHGSQLLFVFSPSCAHSGIPRVTDSYSLPSSGWIPTTLKSSDL